MSKNEQLRGTRVKMCCSLKAVGLIIDGQSAFQPKLYFGLKGRLLWAASGFFFFLYTCLHSVGLAQAVCIAQNLASKQKRNKKKTKQLGRLLICTYPPSAGHAVGRSNPQKTACRSSSDGHNGMSFPPSPLFVLHCVVVRRKKTTKKTCQRYAKNKKTKQRPLKSKHPNMLQVQVSF